jgi:hypothetical protein
MGRKLRDYVVIWNAGVGFIYLIVGTILILLGIDSLHLSGDFTNIINILKTRFTTLRPDEIIIMVVVGIVWLAGVTSFFYVRRCLLEYKTRSIISFLAPFTLTLANALAVTAVFFDIRLLENGSVSLNYRADFINSLNWVGWVAVSVVIISVLFSIIGIVAMIKAAIKPVAIAENEFEKKERIEKEKEKEKLKKEHEKERKKSKAMPVRARASRDKISEEQMMFKSGDVSLEDEKLAAELAARKKNPFLKEPTEEEKKAAADAAEAEKKKAEENPNGVPLAVVKTNEVLSSYRPVLDQPVVASPNISPNISSAAEDEPAAAAAPAAPAEAAPLGGGAIDPAALGLVDEKPADPNDPNAPIKPATPTA